MRSSEGPQGATSARVGPFRRPDDGDHHLPPGSRVRLVRLDGRGEEALPGGEARLPRLAGAGVARVSQGLAAPLRGDAIAHARSCAGHPCHPRRHPAARPHRGVRRGRRSGPASKFTSTTTTPPAPRTSPGPSRSSKRSVRTPR